MPTDRAGRGPGWTGRRLALLLLPLALTACQAREEAPAPAPGAPLTAEAAAKAAPKRLPVPDAIVAKSIPAPVIGAEGATPMAERVATLGLLNKRNGTTRTLILKPGQAIRAGGAVVRLRACEQTPPWERPRETGAFVQLLVKDVRADNYRLVHSGWLFRERPERNVVQHPVFDVYVQSCAMRWPGVAAPDEGPGGDSAERRSTADQSPRANGNGGSPVPATGPVA